MLLYVATRKSLLDCWVCWHYQFSENSHCMLFLTQELQKPKYEGCCYIHAIPERILGVCPKFFFVLWIYVQSRTLGSEFRGCLWGWTLSRKVLSSDCSNTYRKDFIISTIMLSLPPWLSTVVPLWDKEIVYKIPVFFPRVVQGVSAKKLNITFLRLESIQ